MGFWTHEIWQDIEKFISNYNSSHTPNYMLDIKDLISVWKYCYIEKSMI